MGLLSGGQPWKNATDRRLWQEMFFLYIDIKIFFLFLLHFASVSSLVLPCQILRENKINKTKLDIVVLWSAHPRCNEAGGGKRQHGVGDGVLFRDVLPVGLADGLQPGAEQENTRARNARGEKQQEREC